MSACNSTTNQQTAEQNTTEAKTEMESEENEQELASPVQLNNGAKWEANAETTQGITNMKKLVSEFPVSATSQNYADLKVKLVSELNTILQKCTMTGAAHEQLHNYLLPLKDMIGNLDKSTPQESGKVLDQIRIRLSEYDQYFM
jgi:hypothetical protein